MEEISQMPQSSIAPEPQIYPSPTPQNPSNSFLWFRKIGRVFGVSIWIILFLFAPPTVLVLLSQNSLPGDLIYPVKRGMESAILAIASVSPATKTAFRTDLTTTRFKEAQTLLLNRSDTTGLTSFIAEIKTTQQELVSLSDENKKKELTEKLLTKIDGYQNTLTQTESQIHTTSPTFILSTPTPTLTPTPTPTSTLLAQPTVSPPVVSSEKPTPTVFITPTPTSFTQKAPEQPPVTPSEAKTKLELEKKEAILAIDQTQKVLSDVRVQLSENREDKKDKKQERRNEEKNDNKERKGENKGKNEED